MAVRAAQVEPGDERVAAASKDEEAAEKAAAEKAAVAERQVRAPKLLEPSDSLPIPFRFPF